MSDIDNWSPEALRKQFPVLQREINGQALHYLDNAASTFSPLCVQEAQSHYENHYRSNVQRGMHQLGIEATDAYEAARATAAKFLNATSADEIVFTSGTTFAVNLVAQCLGESLEVGDEVVVSVAEHHSNFIPWQRLQQRYGVKLKLIPVLANGSLDLSQLDEIITERCRVLAVSHVSNVTGSITALAPLTQRAHTQGAVVFVDGAQAAPLGPIDLQSLDVDFYAFSAHKCYGPNGVGVLWGRRQLLEEMPPFLTGGGMIERVTVEETRFVSGNRRFEAGTPPVAQAIGLGAALEWMMTLPWPEIHQHKQHLGEQLLRGLEGINGLFMLGESTAANRAPIYSFNIPGCHSHDVCHILDDYGVALRGGHHCAQPLMDALDLVATTRASIAVFNNEQDIAALLEGLHQAVELLR